MRRINPKSKVKTENKPPVQKMAEQHVIKFDSPFYPALDYLCFLSKNLYNTAIYTMRQAYFNNKGKLPEDREKLPSYYDLDKDKNEDYRALQANWAQQTLMLAAETFNGYFKSLAAYRKDPSKFTGRPNLPNYLHKEKGRQVLTLPHPMKEQDGVLPFPKEFDGFKVKRLVSYPAKSIRVVPGNRHYTVEILYEVPAIETKPDNGRYYGIDLGVSNFATVVSNTGENPYIINGKGLKSLNQYWNKRNATYAATAEVANGIKETARLSRLANNRNNAVKDFMHKASRKVIDSAIQSDISVIVVGKNVGWKNSCDMGKQSNQSFVQIPHANFINLLTYKAALAGIKVVVTEESHTSKTSFLDGEKPEHKDRYLGKRVYRGLYRSANGTLLNADVNGACQILRKVFPGAFAEGIADTWFCPVIINLS